MLAKDMLRIKDTNQLSSWLSRYSAWCVLWDDFLKEKTCLDNGQSVWTHENLVKAKNGLNVLIGKKTLFTYLDPDLTTDGPLPATNNKIEGAVNALLRQTLRDHRGLSLIREIKAVFWWCYMHTEFPLPPSELLRVMPTDESIAELYRNLSGLQQRNEGIPGWGDAVVWGEFHNEEPYRMDWD
jgi:hypothetical protein